MTQSLYNPVALKQLPSASPSRVHAALLEYNLNDTNARLWEFLLPPQTLSYSRAATYNEQATLGAAVNDWQYSSTTGQRLTIENLILQTFCQRRSLRPLVEGINELLEAKVGEGIYSPPVLLFSWGATQFGPCVLLECQYDEVGWLAGEPARLQMSLTLQEVPRPPSAGTPIQPAQDVQANDRQAEGLPRLPLTLRQRQDGSTRALNWLRDNTTDIPATLRPTVLANRFRLSTDTETGNVVMVGSGGEALGIVGRWTGREFVTENVQEFE